MNEFTRKFERSSDESFNGASIISMSIGGNLWIIDFKRGMK
jgi:hypothetical protein